MADVGVDVTPLETERGSCWYVGERTDEADEAEELRLRIWRVAGELWADGDWVEIGGRPRRADLEDREVDCWACVGWLVKGCVWLDEGRLIRTTRPLSLNCSLAEGREMVDGCLVLVSTVSCFTSSNAAIHAKTSRPKPSKSPSSSTHPVLFFCPPRSSFFARLCSWFRKSKIKTSISVATRLSISIKPQITPGPK